VLRRVRLGCLGPRTWAGARLYTCQRVTTQQPSHIRTPKSKLRRGISAGLVVSDETQDLAEAGHGQQTAVLRVCYLPYLSQYSRRKLGALEELDGNLAGDDAQLLCVGLLEQELEDALLLRGEVEDGLVCTCLAAPSTNYVKTQQHTQFAACREVRHGCFTADGLARGGDGGSLQRG
jgi:hypothetical protein